MLGLVFKARSLWFSRKNLEILFCRICGECWWIELLDIFFRDIFFRIIVHNLSVWENRTANRGERTDSLWTLSPGQIPPGHFPQVSSRTYSPLDNFPPTIIISINAYIHLCIRVHTYRHAWIHTYIHNIGTYIHHICMYVRILWMYVCMYVCMYICMYVLICMYVCIYMRVYYVCMYAYMCMYVCAYIMYVCMYAYVCMYVCTQMYVCVYACMYVFMYVQYTLQFWWLSCFTYQGGNCPSLRWNCPGGICQGESVRGGNCPGGNCPTLASSPGCSMVVFHSQTQILRARSEFNNFESAWLA